MVATLSSRIAKAFGRSDVLQVARLPCDSPRVALGMIWHRRLEHQPAQRWLRGLIEAVCARL